jgi:hypothetical protein
VERAETIEGESMTTWINPKTGFGWSDRSLEGIGKAISSAPKALQSTKSRNGVLRTGDEP